VVLDPVCGTENRTLAWVSENLVEAEAGPVSSGIPTAIGIN